VTADARAALERTFRDEWARVLAGLARHVGVGVAEEATADAFAQAADAWPRDGVPRNPAAWLAVAARRRAIDRLRRERSQVARADALAALPVPAAEEPGSMPDDRLELLFTCCHPALSEEAQVALTLRAVGGLETAQVARAFLVTEPAMAQRLVRAKHKIEAAGIPFRMPDGDELPGRLHTVLHVLYLVFNEGYEATAGDALGRPDLAAEAIRLSRLLAVLMPDEPEALGLLALMLLTDARAPGRTDADGAFVGLAEQDRTRWDRALAGEGNHVLRRAIGLRNAGPFQLQAMIASLHVLAPSFERTDWNQIAELYGLLAQAQPSPVIEINRAAALTLAGACGRARQLIDPLLADPRLRSYVPLHATDAELHRLAGDAGAAREAYDRAIAASANAVQRSELARRRAAI